MRNYSRRGFGSANRQPRSGENDRYVRQDNYSEEFGATRSVFYDDDSDEGYKETPYRERRYYGEEEDIDRRDYGSSYSNPNRYQEQRVDRDFDRDANYGYNEGYSRGYQRNHNERPERSQQRRGNRGYQGNNRNRY
ncbi:MAG: hypothetical protein JNN29_06110 [Chitinophagaceae bacterium]|nr:hypothetical protein [Chitinophagaceae bacterium]